LYGDMFLWFKILCTFPQILADKNQSKQAFNSSTMVK
jgi:hypothetical protein